ncbi:universal stress protein [Glutamicibacter halophytocola]|uniref:universal stress protein n=1 Tax=Glutamicibacter halophytocola TaxID=1933880 RepID=UPI00321A1A98
MRSANGKLTRLTAFVGDRPGAKDVIEHSASLAAACSLPLRVVTLVLPFDVQDPERDLEGHVENTRSYLAELTRSMDLEASIEVVVGRNLDEATGQLSWQGGDLALLGSARLAAARRLFIGPKAQRILGKLSVPMGGCPQSRIQQLAVSACPDSGPFIFQTPLVERWRGTSDRRAHASLKLKVNQHVARPEAG